MIPTELLRSRPPRGGADEGEDSDAVKMKNHELKRRCRRADRMYATSAAQDVCRRRSIVSARAGASKQTFLRRKIRAALLVRLG